MKITFSEQAWEDYLYWVRNDRKMLARLNRLIGECTRTPFTGTGKPEPLRHNLAGYWSRRMTEGHRLVYEVEGEALLIAQCRYHY